jgi:predicted dinucleotide-binding enzyme
MRIAVFGTGTVGKTLAHALGARGHQVVIGTRDPSHTLARDGEALRTWLAANPAVSLARFVDAARDAELVINATSGNATLAAVGAAAPALDGKVLVDVSNPLDFSGGFPPRLSVCNDDSLGEQVQRAVPGARVVKALNTVNADLMVNPRQLADGAHTMFLCGDDAAAKAVVRALLEDDFGWRDVLDLGGLSMARGTEMLLPLWTRVWGALKTPAFSFQVVR